MPVVRSVMKPRVRGVAGGEVKLPTWEQYREQAPLGQRALEQILCGVPTRNYHRSLESFWRRGDRRHRQVPLARSSGRYEPAAYYGAQSRALRSGLPVWRSGCTGRPFV